MAEQSKPSEMKQERNPGEGNPGEPNPGEGAKRSDAPERTALERIASLERLRDRVETTARQMRRLREENAALSERIKELERRPDVDPAGTFLTLEEEPEQLKRRIAAFIEAIDGYLERERSGAESTRT
jgi:hypothetical protein